MAFVWKTELEERVGSFVVEDRSGHWSGDYKYGYGLPTIIPLWVRSVVAYITPPGSPMSIVKDFGASFAGDGNKFQVMPWDLGGREKIESGLWKVELVMEGTDDKGNNFTYRSKSQALFTKEVQCCVDKMTANTLNVPLNDLFRDEKTRKTSELSMLLSTVLNADCCDIKSADRIVTYIKLHCRCGC